MGFLDYLISDIRTTLGGFTMLGPRFSWLFLVSAALIAVIFYNRDPDEPWSLRRAVRATFPKRVFLHPSALLDYRYAVINYVIRIAAFGVFMASSDQIASSTLALLDLGLGANAPETARAGIAAIVLTTLLLVLALDFGLFFAHYLMHRFPVLWEFHKVHHSAEMLTPATVFRMHPVDMVINSWVVAICVGFVNGVFAHFHPDPADGKWLFLSNLAVFSFYFFGYHLRHSHVWIMFPRGLRQIISSPALHLIHHSAAREHWDKNFGRIFVFWDRMIGAACIPDTPQEIRFGLGTDEDGEYDTVYKLYMLPFQKAARLIRPRARVRGEESAPPV